MPAIESKVFKQFKTNEYFELIAKNILNFRQATNSKSATKLLVDNLFDYVLTIKPEWLSSEEILAAHFNSVAVAKITNSFFSRYQNAFLDAIQKNYENMIDLGIRHQIYDFLYQIPVMQKFFDKQIGNFSSLVDTALFAKTNQRKEIEIKNTRRSGLTKRAVLNLLDKTRGIDIENLFTSEDEFDEMGLTELERDKVRADERYDAYVKLGKRYEAQLNLKIADQTHEFVSTLNKIADFTRFAKASRKDFLADNYLKQRRRVLQVNFKSRTDENIRKSISSFLISNREDFVRVNSLRTKTDADIKLLRTRLNYFIEKDMEEQRSYLPTKGSETIIRTELSIAYNFGKIAGFGSKEDQYKRFRWVADRELAFVTNKIKNLKATTREIEDAPCEFCRIHDGLEYFLYEITNNGLKTGDILNYGSKTRGSQTIWRNWNNPQIPAHPSCACHWVLVDDDLDVEDARQKIAVQRPDGTGRLSVKKFVNAAVVVAGAAAVAATIWKTGLGSAIGKALYNNFDAKSISPADIPRIVKEGLDGIKQYRLPETVLKQINSAIVPELDKLGLPIRLDMLN